MHQLTKPPFTTTAFWQSIAILGDHGVDAYHEFLDKFAEDNDEDGPEQEGESDSVTQRREYMMLAGLN